MRRRDARPLTVALRERLGRLLLQLRGAPAVFWLAAVAVGVLWLPWAPALDALSNSPTSFLQALWQVEGAALGLSLAVVLFAFQAVYGQRRAATLGEFAEETWLFPIFYAGLLGLVVDGVVLLGGGRGAPGGWAATWAAVWAGGTAVSLAWLFVRTVRALEPSELQELRLRRIDSAVRREVEDVIFRRIALNRLHQYLEEIQVDSPVLLGSPQRGRIAVSARHEGMISDIKLHRLARAAAHARRLKLNKPQVRVHIGNHVRAGTQIAWLDQEQMRTARRLSRAFRIQRRSERDFRRTLDDLHEEALRAIEMPSPTTYGEIADLYEHIFLALPETWARYGAEYRDAIAGGAGLFEITAHDHLERQLYEEMTLAARSRSRDIAQDALDLPIQVAQRALELRALALSKRMLALWVAARRWMLRYGDDEDVRSLLSWSWLRLSEYGYRPARLIEDEADQDSQELGRDALLQIFDAYAEMLKHIVDLRPADTELLADVNEQFDYPLQHWNPEHQGPDEWYVEAAVRRGAEEAELEQLRSEVRDKQRRVGLKKEIFDWRDLHRFGLLFWIVRNVRDGADPERWLPALGALRGYFSDPNRMLEILDKGIAEDWEDRGRWSWWVMETETRRSRRAVHGIAVDLEFIQTFVVLALASVSPDGPPPTLTPQKRVYSRLTDPRTTVRAVVDSDALRALLPEDRIDERAEHLIAALEAMREQQRRADEDATIAASIDAEKTRAFEESLRSAWRQARELSEVLVPRAPAVTEPSASAGAFWSQWFSKESFVAGSSVVGLDDVARDAGKSLAGWEWIALLSAVGAAPAPAAEEAAIATQIRAAIEELRAAGYAPTVVVVPMNWNLFTQDDLQWVPNRGGDAEMPEWLVADVGNHAFLGYLDGVPVVEEYDSGRGNELPPHAIYVLDLHRLARFQEWETSAGGDSLEVEVQAFDEAAARDAITSGRVNFEDGMTEDEKLRLLQRRVRVSARYAFEIEVVDLQAARRLEVPPNLREE
jgi:hypothetical protein